MAELTHAGGIVMRFHEDAPRYLVVTAKSDSQRWIFPKGKIDEGETAQMTAEREVEEEAWVTATIIDSVGSIEFDKYGRTVAAEYFLMSYVRDTGRGEDRKRRWCKYEDALGLLVSNPARTLLRRAHAMATKLLHTSGD